MVKKRVSKKKLNHKGKMWNIVGRCGVPLYEVSTILYDQGYPYEICNDFKSIAHFDANFHHYFEYHDLLYSALEEHTKNLLDDVAFYNLIEDQDALPDSWYNFLAK